MGEAMEEGTTLPLLLPFSANSVAPTRSWSSSCRIVKSAKVGYTVDEDRPAFTNSPDPACSRMVVVKGDDREAVVAIGGCVVATGGVVKGGTGGLSWELT